MKFDEYPVCIARAVLTCLGALGHQANGAPMGRVSGVGAVARDFRVIFSRQIRISGFHPDFFVQVRIGPYILAQG